MSRIVFHIDVNSAFLSWEAVYRLDKLGEEEDIRTQFAAIGGDESMRHGIVLAKSELAKSCGVTTGEALMMARRKCPELKVYPTRFEWYVQCSNKLMEYLNSRCYALEQFSIDEAWCDMTGIVCNKEQAIAYAKEIADYVRSELHFTVNIGIAQNKLLAKMASGFTKPDRIHTLFNDEIADKMWKLPVSELFYVGGATAKRLGDFGIYTIGQLAKVDRNILVANFKKQGIMLYDYANGIDDSPVENQKAELKGYGNSMTIPFDVISMQQSSVILMSLSETVAARLRAAKVKATTLAVSYTDSDFNKKSKQMSLEKPSDITAEIYEYSVELLKALWNEACPLRLLGVHAVKITKEEFYQHNIFETKDSNDRRAKQEKLDETIDSIRKKFGDNAIFRASYMDSEIPHISSGLSRMKDKHKQKNS